MSIKKTPCIEVNQLNFQINDTDILKDISFTINKGDYVGIIGPNGGGKTTLLKLILGLLKPSSGTICISAKTIGYVPQKITQASATFPTTVEEVVQSGRTVKRGWLKRFGVKDSVAVEKAMRVTGIEKYRNKLISQLSGGERQSVFIARALAAEPDVLILDEPTTGVDIGHQETFYRFLRQLHEELNLTVIYVSHDIDFIAKEVGQVVCLNQSLVCHTSPRDFLTKENLEKIYGPNSKIILHHH